MTLVVSSEAEQDVQVPSLAEVDGAWGRCRELTNALHHAYREHLGTAAAAHHAALDTAWDRYQREIVTQGEARRERRSERVARARLRYNEATAGAYGAYEIARMAALEALVSGLDIACVTYEGAVDTAIRTMAGLDEPSRR